MKKSNRNTFQKQMLSAAVGSTILPSVSADIKDAKHSKSRNQIASMRYQSLGKTNMLISQIVMGTAFWKDESVIPLFDRLVDSGVNYVDASPAYQRGESERILGKLMKRQGLRDRLFIANKISFYDEFLTRLTNEIFNGLPNEKKQMLRKRADIIMQKKNILRPGYHFTYFKNQSKKIELSCLRYVINQEYGRLKSWKSKIKARMHELVIQSLKKSNADYFDVLFCPHGVAIPEMLEDESIREVMDELKQKGIIRASAVSMHNDVAGNLDKAVDLGFYDVSMIAFNIGNYKQVYPAVKRAADQGMGLIAMKAARIMDTPEEPQKEIQQLDMNIKAPLSIHAKGYIWALKQDEISACVSDMKTIEQVEENLSIFKHFDT
jgi:predicted aldo/keto reductase-like oxidoreductase